MYSEHENAYGILGISRNATSVDLKKAYTSLIRLAHPDKGGNSEDFQRIQSAYDSLKDIIGRKRTAPVDHAASAAATAFLFRGKRVNFLGSTCFSRDASKRPCLDERGRVKHGFHATGIKEDVHPSTPASMQAELRTKVKPPACATGTTRKPTPPKRVAPTLVKQSLTPNSAEPAKEKLLTDEELHSLRNQISQAEGREARLKLLQHLPKRQAQQLGEFMQQFPIPPQAEASKEKLLTDEELHSLRNQISQAEGREARLKLIQHLPKCQAQQLGEFMQQFPIPPNSAEASKEKLLTDEELHSLRGQISQAEGREARLKLLQHLPKRQAQQLGEFMQQFASPPSSAEPPKEKLLTDEELHSLRNQVSQVEGREARLKLLQHLPKCQAQQLHQFMRQFGRPDIPDVSSGAHAAPQSEPKPEESHAKPEPPRKPQVRCTDGVGSSDDDDSLHPPPSSDVPPETGGSEAADDGERYRRTSPDDDGRDDDNIAALFADISNDTHSFQARYFEEASGKRLQEIRRRSMGGSEERELCWGFSHKRQKWHQVYVYPSVWEGADEKINVAYSQDPASREYSMHRHSITRTEPAELKAAKGRGGLEHQLFLQKSLFQAVKIGKKKWEGRINDLKAKQIKVGDFIVFNKILRREVFDRRTYKTFKEMLSDIGTHEILPGCTDVETAIGIFQNFPNNRLNCKHGKTNEEIYGCVAFQLSEMPVITSIPSSSSTSSSIPAPKPPRTPSPEEKINLPPVSRNTICGPSFQKPRIEVGIRDESEEEGDILNDNKLNCGPSFQKPRIEGVGIRDESEEERDILNDNTIFGPSLSKTTRMNDEVGIRDESEEERDILNDNTILNCISHRDNCNDRDRDRDPDDDKPIECAARRPRIGADHEDAAGHDLDCKRWDTHTDDRKKKRFRKNDGVVPISLRVPEKANQDQEEDEDDEDDDGIITLDSDSDSDVPLINPNANANDDDAPLIIF